MGHSRANLKWGYGMASKKKPHAEMEFFEHLDELRKRLIYIAIVIFIAAIVCYCYRNEILDFLTKPAEDLELIYITPAEAFMSQIRLALSSAVIITMPFTIYQVMAFIVPGLRRTEKKSLYILVFSMIILFVLGISFGYLVVFPYALIFFLGFTRRTGSSF